MSDTEDEFLIWFKGLPKEFRSIVEEVVKEEGIKRDEIAKLAEEKKLMESGKYLQVYFRIIREERQ